MSRQEYDRKQEGAKCNFLQFRVNLLRFSLSENEFEIFEEDRSWCKHDKLNRSDVKKKIDNYRQESKELRDRLEAIILEYKKKLLLKKASSRSQQTHQENIELLEDLYQRNRNI